MAPRKKAAEPAPVFDISQFREEKRYVWRDIETEREKPLRVKVEDLSIRQTNDIPWGLKVPLAEAFAAIPEYIVEWTLEAENLSTGEVVPVPPPAEVGWEVLELLTNDEGSSVVNWLKVPQYMKAAAEKKSQSESDSTSMKASGSA